MRYLRLELSKEVPVRAWNHRSWWDCPGRLWRLGEKEGSENCLVMKGKVEEVETSKEIKKEEPGQSECATRKWFPGSSQWVEF